MGAPSGVTNVPPEAEKRSTVARALGYCALVKRHVLPKKCQNTVGKQHSGNTAKTGAGRKGELLRGKVSQGRPRPLSIALVML